MERKDRAPQPACHYVPPVGRDGARLEQVRRVLIGTLGQFVKSNELNEAIDAVIRDLKPMLNLPKPPEKGATVMTEGASARNEQSGGFTTGPKNL